MEILTAPRPVLSEHTEASLIEYRDGSESRPGRVCVWLDEGSTVTMEGSADLLDMTWPSARWYEVSADLIDGERMISFNVSGYLWYRLRFTLPNR